MLPLRNLHLLFHGSGKVASICKEVWKYGEVFAEHRLASALIPRQDHFVIVLASRAFGAT